jgi:hypothetical protein
MYHPLRLTLKARGLSAEKMGIPLPAGPSPIFSLTPAIFCEPLRLAVFEWNCCLPNWDRGRFLGISGKQSEGEMPKNRYGKKPRSGFSVFVRTSLKEAGRPHLGVKADRIAGWN